ncbi:MAG TPA: hypothetical protein VIJ42_03330 [Stellaceae bacterium]
MTIRYLLSAAALVGALAIGVPAMAADNGDMNKPAAEKSMAKPMDNSMDKPATKSIHRRHHHAMRHHRAMHKDAAMDKGADAGMDKPMHHASAHHRMHMHGARGPESKEQAETTKLNQEQVQMNGAQH